MQDQSHRIHVLELGPMANLIYLIEDRFSRRAAVIDPAWDVPEIETLARALGVTISDVLLTHCHHDHINGLGELLSRHDAELHLIRQEHRFWEETDYQPTLHDGGDVIQLGKTEIKVLHTPGHTPGSACYHIGDDLLTGDTLFVFGCGRCDLEGGDAEVMFKTLQDIKHKLPLGTVIHPGHHYAPIKTVTLEQQVQGNPFMHFDSPEHFRRYRMEDHGKTRSTPYQAIAPEEIKAFYSES